ncbi:MAG: thermonuclease family protein [Gaiellaceae bacterium]
MPFTVISGTFHLVGRTRTGRLTGFEPDGDSIQFRPHKPKLLDGLERTGSPWRRSSIGSTQLRFEGIDALELHFDGLHQPRPLADQARDFLTGKLALNPVPYEPPSLIQVLPPVARDATPGYILSRALEPHGRPVAFAFTGDAPDVDGASFFLTSTALKRSLNYKILAAGHAYPLFYDTLFRDLRESYTRAVASARQKRLGLWAQDRTRTGLYVSTRDKLARDAVVFPKLFRRLAEYLKVSTSMIGFLPWLEATKEQVLDLTTSGFTHLDDLLDRSGRTISMKVDPEKIVVVSAKTSNAEVFPWLRH